MVLDKITEWQKSGRNLPYPYTLTSQIRQFPYKFYWQNQWIFKYWIISCGLCMPVFMWIQSKARSPENIEKWRKIREKERAEHH